MRDDFSRRVFLNTGSMAGAAGAFAEEAHGVAPATLAPAPSWVDRPMRWAQLTLVEDDPGKIDPRFWLDYFRRTHSDAVCLSAGGCVAFYPTEARLHHRSRWLGNRDVFGELVKGCRDLGMVVLARIDPHATYDDVQQTHPDWIAVDAAGRPRRHWASPELWVTCALGPYNFDFMTRVHREITARYRVDGINIRRWSGHGQCFCNHCRALFLAANCRARTTPRIRRAGRTSLYDEWGARRNDLGLADLFGVSFRSKAEGPMRNAYLRLEDDPRTRKRHPLLDGLDDAPRIIHGTSRLELTPRRAFPNPPLTLIPSYPDLPTEMVYPRVARTEVPEVYVSEIGAGRVVYFPWDIDRVFWDVLAVDHGLLLRNAVRWAANDNPPAEVKGPGVLDVSVWRQQRSMTVHLVNLTNPMMMKGPFRELIPVGEQHVVVRLPAGARARRVQLLREGRVLPVSLEGAQLSLKVPSIRDHEVVAIDLG